MPEPSLTPKAVKEDLCSGDKMQNAPAWRLTSAPMSADARFFVLCKIPPPPRPDAPRCMR